MTRFQNIRPEWNYRRLSNGQVFTGRQILNLLELATPAMQAVILLDIQQTEQAATNAGSRYGATAAQDGEGC